MNLKISIPIYSACNTPIDEIVPQDLLHLLLKHKFVVNPAFMAGQIGCTLEEYSDSLVKTTTARFLKKFQDSILEYRGYFGTTTNIFPFKSLVTIEEAEIRKIFKIVLDNNQNLKNLLIYKYVLEFLFSRCEYPLTINLTTTDSVAFYLNPRYAMGIWGTFFITSRPTLNISHMPRMVLIRLNTYNNKVSTEHKLYITNSLIMCEPSIADAVLNLKPQIVQILGFKHNGIEKTNVTLSLRSATQEYTQFITTVPLFTQEILDKLEDYILLYKYSLQYKNQFIFDMLEMDILETIKTTYVRKD